MQSALPLDKELCLDSPLYTMLRKSQIQKVEFYDDRGVTLTDDTSHPIVVNEGKIAFVEKKRDLFLTLPQELVITVSLYSQDGENVAVLFCGEASKGELALNIKDRGLSSGAYSVLVKTEQALFVRSVALR